MISKIPMYTFEKESAVQCIRHCTSIKNNIVRSDIEYQSFFYEVFLLPTRGKFDFETHYVAYYVIWEGSN